MVSSVMRTGGGRFDPQEKPVYFIASGTERLESTFEVNNHILIAVNEIQGEHSREFLERIGLFPDKKLFLDSGVFSLAMDYVRKYKVSHNIALSMAPDEIEGFSALYEKYIDVVQTYKDHLWGYIEIDQGGRENKIKTRAKLEALGLRPIPVYHPFTDGWDYFDYLAERYDRICFGNIVKASAPVRKRLVATAWERHRKYPNLWIHFLGLTPNQWLNAFPMNSGDSSAWLAPLRWPVFNSHCDGQAVGVFSRDYRYELGSDSDGPRGAYRAIRLVGYQSRMNMLTWRGHMDDIQETCQLDSLYPPYQRGEEL